MQVAYQTGRTFTLSKSCAWLKNKWEEDINEQISAEFSESTHPQSVLNMQLFGSKLYIGFIEIL